jgi:hypothetical protein
MDRKHAEMVVVTGKPVSTTDVDERKAEAGDTSPRQARPYAPSEEGAMMETSCPNCTCS